MSYFDPGNGNHIVVDGHIVERDALRVAEAIKEYDPNLEVICVDQDKADVGEAPFIICEYVDGKYVRVFEAWQLDDRVLDRIKLADKHVFDLEAQYQIKKKEIEDRKKARYRDIMDSKKDIVQFVASHNKSKTTYRDEETDDLVTIYDDRPSSRLNNVKVM